LLQAGPVTASAAARQQLRRGQVNSRLLLTLGEVASQWPITIMVFGDRGPGASPGIPFRAADLVVTGGKAGPGSARQVQLMSVFLHQLGGYIAGCAHPDAAARRRPETCADRVHRARPVWIAPHICPRTLIS
jgi:hypothetical protein